MSPNGYGIEADIRQPPSRLALNKRLVEEETEKLRSDYAIEFFNRIKQEDFEREKELDLLHIRSEAVTIAREIALEILNKTQ